MHTRRTHDYTPTMAGSKEENQAINARREMMKVFDSTPVRTGAKRKSWHERMLENANGFQYREPAKQKGPNVKEMFSLEARARFVAPRKAERKAA